MRASGGGGGGGGGRRAARPRRTGDVGGRDARRAERGTTESCAAAAAWDGMRADKKVNTLSIRGFFFFSSSDPSPRRGGCGCGGDCSVCSVFTSFRATNGRASTADKTPRVVVRVGARARAGKNPVWRPPTAADASAGPLARALVLSIVVVVVGGGKDGSARLTRAGAAATS